MAAEDQDFETSGDFELLDEVLRSGSIHGASATNARVKALADKGLVCAISRRCDAAEDQVFIVTVWGRLVWRRERARADVATFWRRA